MEDLFVKAYCDKAKQYYGLRVETVDGALKVTDFYDIDAETAKKLASSADVPNLETASNLRDCAACHTHRVASCACPKSRNSCQPDQGYRFQCIYCQQLRIFSKSEGAEVMDAERVGNRVRLTQGQEVAISAVGPGALEHILVGVGWDISLSSQSMDIDSSVFLKNRRRGNWELVYFGNLHDQADCVVHLGDNLVGGKYADNSQATDSENINVYLNKVPETYDELYFVLNIYACERRNQTFRDVRNLYIRLTNAKTGQRLVEYEVTSNMSGKTGLIIGKAYKTGNQWMFRAIGKPVLVGKVFELEPFCID